MFHHHYVVSICMIDAGRVDVDCFVSSPMLGHVSYEM